MCSYTTVVWLSTQKLQKYLHFYVYYASQSVYLLRDFISL